jgi:actin related protein 2/3 complex subunit 5
MQGWWAFRVDVPALTFIPPTPTPIPNHTTRHRLQPSTSPHTSKRVLAIVTIPPQPPTLSTEPRHSSQLHFRSNPSAATPHLSTPSSPLTTMAATNYRTIQIDALDPDAPPNFPLSSLLPSNLPPPATSSEMTSLAQQVRQHLRSGDAESALLLALEHAPLGGDDLAKDVHLGTVLEVLMGVRQSDVGRVLEGVVGKGGRGLDGRLMGYIYKGMATSSSTASSGGVNTPSTPQRTDTGFSQAGGRNFGEGGGGQVMSVLLSWHEKLVEVAGVGCIVRVMTDRRTV